MDACGHFRGKAAAEPESGQMRVADSVGHLAEAYASRRVGDVCLNLKRTLERRSARDFNKLDHLVLGSEQKR